MYSRHGALETYLLGRDGLLARLPELLDRLRIVSQILLAANKDDGKTLAEVKHLRDPLYACQRFVTATTRSVACLVTDGREPLTFS